MKKVFNIYVIILITFITIWWLNRPFSDSHKDNISYKVLTENNMVKELVSELAGPEIEVLSIQKGKNNGNWNESEFKSADLIILDGFNSGLLAMVRESKSKDTELLLVRELIRKSMKGKKVEKYYWMSLKQWMALTYGLHLNLKMQFPELRSEINYRFNHYMKDIQSLIEEVSKKIEILDQDRKFIASYHPSIKVFADDFDIKYFDLSINNNEELKIKDKIDLIIENNITTIVTINSIDNDSLDEIIKLALAKGEVIKLTEPVHSLHLGAKQSNIGTYKSLMLSNSDTIIDGMKN